MGLKQSCCWVLRSEKGQQKFKKRSDCVNAIKRQHVSPYSKLDDLGFHEKRRDTRNSRQYDIC